MADEELKIIVKDPVGTDCEYPYKEKLRVNLSDGTKQVYSKGEAVENVAVALDFSNGDQTITAPEGMLVKSAVISKPETLIPENIAEGVDIAGIVGMMTAGGSSNINFEIYEKSMYISLTTNSGVAKTTIILSASELPEWWPAAGEMPPFCYGKSNPIYIAIIARISGSGGQQYLQGSILSNFTGYASNTSYGYKFGASATNPSISTTTVGNDWNYTTENQLRGLFQNENGIGVGSYNAYSKCNGTYRLVLLKIDPNS